MSYHETSKNHESVNASTHPKEHTDIENRCKKRVMKALIKLRKENNVLKNIKNKKIRKNAKINTSEIVEFASFISSISAKKLALKLKSETTPKKDRSSSYEESVALNSTKS